MINYPLSDDTWGQEEIDAINEVIASRRFTMGAKTREFEEMFAVYFGAKYAVMVNSGSSANLIAIAALVFSGKLNEGDEVIVPAVSWSTSYYPLYQYGLKLRFVDICIDTLNIDPQLVREAITKKTKAVLSVNLLGNSCEYDILNEICREFNLLLIEDNCEALGAKYKEQYTGTFGIIGTFSSFYSHHICTMEGGVAITDNEELYHYMLSLRAHGWTRDLPVNSKIHSKSSSLFYESFNFILPGYNLRPLEIEAAIGSTQLKKIPNIINNRRGNAAYFKKLFFENKVYSIQKELGESSWFGFAIILNNTYKGIRKKIIDKLISNEIEVRPIVAGNFTKNRVIKYMNHSIYSNLNNANYIHDNGFFIGNHSINIHSNINDVFNILNSIN